jgi:hypothetical protein
VSLPKNKAGKLDVPKAEAMWKQHTGQKTSSVNLFDYFSDEMSKISVAIVKNPADTLDKRTSRHFRKPNPRVLPAPMPSGKLVV